MVVAAEVAENIMLEEEVLAVAVVAAVAAEVVMMAQMEYPIPVAVEGDVEMHIL
jgi:hypothetical protein